MSGVEIRVHGVGEHAAWSSLGSAPLVHPGEGFTPETALPPVLPAHRLWLVNWSRTSRGRAGWLWYVALPYTLVNVAGYMEPREADDARRNWLQRVTLILVGLLLTLCTYVWAVALLETLARRLLVDWGSHAITGVAIALLTGAGLIAGMMARPRVRPQAAVARPLLGAHIGLVVVATLFALFRPAHWTWNASHAIRWLTTLGPVPADTPGARCFAEGRCYQSSFDPVTTVALASIALTLFLAATIAVRGAWLARAATGSSEDEASVARRNAAAACTFSVAIVSSVLLLNSVASALRLFLDNGMAYLSRHGLLVWQAADTTASFEGRGVLPGLPSRFGARDNFLIDVLSLLGLFAVLAFVLALLCVNVLAGDGAGRFPLFGDRPRRQTQRARWIHRTISRLAWTLPATSILALMLFALAVAVAATLLFSTRTPRWWDVAVVLIQGVSVLTTAVVLSGRGGSARRALSRVADVLGFWPIREHPLGGASYRDDVVSVIRARVSEVDGRVALVGHSQGSVLVAWAVGSPDAPDRRRGLLLVTCGSPLRSLYGTFFPRHFDEGFVHRVKHCASAGWVNFWRATDPIATPLNGGIGNVELGDPSGGHLRGHGDYWIEATQVARTSHFLAEEGAEEA
jgi:hypothetical protein